MDDSVTVLTNENIAREMVRRIPGFVDVYQEHVRDLGELNLSVLFANLFDFTVNLARLGRRSRGNRHPQSVIREVVDFLEDAAHSDDHRVVDLVLTGFMENLEPDDPDHQSVAALLKPESQRLLDLSRT
jgi:hypothetical protein